MFVYLSKLLPVFVYPLGLVLLLLLAALVFGRLPAWPRFLLILAVGIILVSGNRWVADGLVRSLEWRYLPPEEIPTVEAIVVLGGATHAPYYPRPMVEIGDAGDRVLYAARLYHQGKAERILLSGGRIDWQAPGGTPAEEMAVLLEMLDVPREALWLEETSRNTYENAVNSRRILEENGIRRILLVTSAAHMSRSAALFEKQGLEVIPAPTDYSITEAEWKQVTGASLPVQLIYFLPEAGNMAQTTGALKEYLGMFVYRLRGWL